MVRALIAVAVCIGVAYLVLVAALVRGRPTENALREALRLVPDLLRLIGRLARDRALPRGLRVRLWLLLAYLASPVDLIPDFVPVVGYADDVIIAALTLRSVVRRAGWDAVRRHWPGTPEGLAALSRLTGSSAARGADPPPG